MRERAVYAGSLDGSAPIYKEIQVNNNQTIESGEVVVLATGKASIGAAGAAAGTVLGVSNTSITTTTATADDIIKYDVNPHSLYRFNYTGAATPAIGAKYALGTNPYEFNADSTTDGFIQVVEKVDTDAKTAVVLICNRVFTGV